MPTVTIRYNKEGESTRVVTWGFDHPVNSLTYGALDKWLKSQGFSHSDLVSLKSNDVIALGQGALSGLVNLEALCLPKLRVANEGAIQGCRSLKQVTLGALTAAPVSMFKGCSSLEALVLPYTHSFGSSCFEDCSNLKLLIIPKAKTEKMGEKIFSRCDQLKHLVMANGCEVFKDPRRKYNYPVPVSQKRAGWYLRQGCEVTHLGQDHATALGKGQTEVLCEVAQEMKGAGTDTSVIAQFLLVAYDAVKRKPAGQGSKISAVRKIRGPRSTPRVQVYDLKS